MRDSRAPYSVEYVPGVGLRPVPGCGQRPRQRSWVTATGARALAADASSGDDHDGRTLTIDDDTDGYTTITAAGVTYYQYDDGGSFPRCLPGGDAR